MPDNCRLPIPSSWPQNVDQNGPYPEPYVASLKIFQRIKILQSKFSKWKDRYDRSTKRQIGREKMRGLEKHSDDKDREKQVDLGDMQVESVGFGNWLGVDDEERSGKMDWGFWLSSQVGCDAVRKCWRWSSSWACSWTMLWKAVFQDRKYKQRSPPYSRRGSTQMMNTWFKWEYSVSANTSIVTEIGKFFTAG